MQLIQYVEGKHKMRNSQILIPLFILTIGALGCSLFSSKTGDAEMVFAATEVGTPEGDKVTKDIGPGGGTLASPDGRMTLTVPQGALTETIAFSMQPITNKAGNGLGLAYRLEPSGKTFTTPLDISVRYDEKDLEGTVPEALSLAYQDNIGAWHAQLAARLNKDTNTLTIATTHFTDFAFLARLRMSPAEATLYVGESQGFRLVTCRELSFFERIRGVDPRDTCTSAPGGRINRWELIGAGSLADAGEGVMYTAPARKPANNIAYIDHTMEFTVREPATGRLSRITETFRAVITILGRGYRATGQTGDVTYSGVICKLEDPFTVTGTSSLNSYPFKFVPNSGRGTSGTVSFNAAVPGIKMEGSGSYIIEGWRTDKPRIAMTMGSVGHTPLGSRYGGGTVYIDLVPLETDECN